MTSNAVIGWPSWTSDVAWSGGNWLGSYPVGNCGNLPLNRVARSTNTALSSTKITGTFTKSRSLQAMGIIRHNFSLGSKLRIKLYGDAGLTDLVYDSDWFDTWPAVYLPGDLEWEDDNWWLGQNSPEEIISIRPHRPVFFVKQYFCRAFTLEIDDQSNPAGFVQLGRLEVSQGWQLSINPAPGYSEGHEFQTASTKALGGVEYFEPKDKPRVARASIDFLPRDEALARGFQWHRDADLHRVFLWFPFPEEPRHWLRTAYLARITDPGLITTSQVDFSTFPIAVKEVL